MTSIRHTRTLFEYDGPQLFEAHDDAGGLYLALMIEHAEGRDRHLAVEVTPDRLEELKAGTLDLKELISAAGSGHWYVVWSSDLTSPLVLEPMAGPIPPEHLPEDGSDSAARSPRRRRTLIRRETRSRPASASSRR